ncbi:hypothetical protein ACE38W_16075 [Chitinophaga sp. Hz27]|uniref:hypothetical protein n=1 Tax=Chitinophaga sp. Hz27 TaxID=3347169 RepID=UPI0035D84E06
MKITAGRYTVVLTNDDAFIPGSADNIVQYSKVYLPNPPDYQCAQLGIFVMEADNMISSALVAAEGVSISASTVPAIVEEARLILCLADTLFCLAIPGLDLVWRVKADTALCFQVFRYREDYIVHGELEISRIDHHGNIVWQRSGADIFTTVDGKEAFWLAHNYIFATDFQNNQYKFDYDGIDIS